MSLRPPTSTLDSPFAAWLSSLTLGDAERRSPPGQQREPLSDSTAGLVQRCVVVQRDSLGFGFTVCGERVKLVQNVRPGGAAVRAGVHEGDRIIKVNGSKVSSMSHQEVVKMIKSGTYVALTLQGPPPSVAALPLKPLPTDLSSRHCAAAGEAPPPPATPPVGSSTPSQRITGPRPLQDPEVQKHASEILRKMLEQEEAELQNLLEEQSKNPSVLVEESIQRARRRAGQVRVKIQQELDGTRSDASAHYLSAGGAQSPSQLMFCTVPADGLSLDSCDEDLEASESPFSSPSCFLRDPCHERRGSDTCTSDSDGKNQIIGPEEEEEDEGYFINETDGPFQDMELLKSRPAHMMVFMRYVFTQLLDPHPLLFYLSVEAYLSSSPKDARSLAPQICSHFLEQDAPLKIPVPDEVLTDMEARLHAQEDVRGPLSELQQQVLPDVQEQLQDYRSKQMLGLGSLFGESDLRELDGDPQKEREAVEKQLQALWELLFKAEEERSSPLAGAVLLCLRHAGVKLQHSRSFSGEKEKRLSFFPRAKKLSGAKRERDGDERRRNPILKYIGKPRSTSQSTFHVQLSPPEVRSGSVRNIIQQFEHSGDSLEDGEAESRAVVMESAAAFVRLARSESLKAQGEGRRRGAEFVPRSRSDVDMEDCEEGAGLNASHHSASSSASSNSARSLENQTPPYTPRSQRRSVAPVALFPDAPLLEEDVIETYNWQETVEPQILMSLAPREIDRQAVIYELFTTEASHLRTLRVLDQIFYQKMQNILSPDELNCVFLNLQQVYELHASFCDTMKSRRESVMVQGIGDIMQARFEGSAGDQFLDQVSQWCGQQSQALDLIKSKQRKDPRFSQLIQECEASPHCRRLQLKDLLVSEMQRLTKYPLLLDNIIRHTQPSSPDLPLLQRALACCRRILQAVNEVVGEAEHRHLLSQYQRRLDLTALERLANPAAAQFKNLDLGTKRLVHEGPLAWRVGKDKAVDVQALLLTDLLLLLQKGPDERLLLRGPSRSLLGGGATFCPIVRLDSCLVRLVATDNKALYVISTSERRIYELVAGTSSEKNTWKDLLERTISSASSVCPAPPSEERADSGHLEEPPQSDDDDDDGRSTPTSEQDQRRGGVAEAALQDVETLRQLIFRDLQDGWSQGSDDTPTNDTPCEIASTDDVGEIVEAPPPVQVMRKAVGAGCSISDVTAGGASEERGNIFYLILPPDQSHALQGESSTDDLGEESGNANQLQDLFSDSSHNEETDPSFGQSQASVARHVIQSVDEIFGTMEALMKKLQHLRDVESDHHQLLKKLQEDGGRR